MKKVLLSLLAVVLIVGLPGAAGFAGYQFGLRQGALSSSNGKSQVSPFPGNNGRPEMPMHNFGFGFGRGFGMRGFGILRHGGMMGFGFFSPLMFLLRILFWALVIWVIYLLITRSGWRLTRQSTANPPVSVQPSAPAESNDNEPVGD